MFNLREGFAFQIDRSECLGAIGSGSWLAGFESSWTRLVEIDYFGSVEC